MLEQAITAKGTPMTTRRELASKGDSALTNDEQAYAITTWRYLRIAMVVLVIGLGVSIGIEHLKTKTDCFQHSISAYYYTPVHGLFVGTLMAVAAALVCLRGNSPREDVVLNIAGIAASIVALVPTPDGGSCTSVPAPTEDRGANIGNNGWVLVGLGVLTMVAIVISVAADRRTAPARPTPVVWFGYAVAFVLWLAGTAVFLLSRCWFLANAHDVAAAIFF